MASALALLGTSGGVWSACIDSLEGTGATTVQNASGQGNFSCGDMNPGPDGGVMSPITNLIVTFAPDNKSVDVEVPANQLTGCGGNTPGPCNEIDAIFITASGKGTRCLYTFSNYTDLAEGLRRSNETFNASSLTVCADGIGAVPPVEPEVIEPISTVGDGCVGDVTVGQTTLDNLALVTAVSLDGNTLAVCNGTGETLQQVQCVNVCENFEQRAETPECAADSTGLTNGELNLEACRPCDLTDPLAPPGVDQNGNPLFYCWEYTNSVVRNPALDPITYPNAPGTQFVPGTTIERTLGTLLPHKEAWSASGEDKVFNGCYKTTRTLNGRLYTYTTCY